MAFSRLFGILIAAASAAAHGAWTPPPNPDPAKILNEAQADARAGRKADALAKHVWFHRHAVNIRPDLRAVRLSLALGAWMDLAVQYAPAMQALKKTRDQAGARARQPQGTRDDFRDYAAINELLGENGLTTKLFAWLDQKKPEAAKSTYLIAQRALVYTKQYKLCSKYIDSDAALERLLRVQREHQRILKEGRAGEDFRDYADTSFAHEAATLVALLAVNNRGAEADRVVAAVLQEKSDPGLRSRLARARDGEVPKPWP